MAPPVWTLMLLVGTAWGRGHLQKPLDWKPVIRSPRDNLLSRCDFEDESKPLCDWSQVSADDGDWIRASGPSTTGTTGPPGGYPSGEGNYLHMVSSTFRRGGVARLRSPYLWVQGPLCVRFVFHMFGLSWGSQLRLLLLSGAQGQRPSVLWKHRNTQSPSWTPTAVTVPAGLALPTQLMFEGVRGNTAYLDIALDALSIHRGSCSRVCMMQMCNFDTPNDLCGWSWVPTASGAKWIQKKGQSGKPGVGPDDDFSSPGSGYYMLLDPRNARPRQKSVFLSPLSHSSGCLSLSFHYILWGQSPGAALHVYASVLGSIRRHSLFSGQPRPNWQPVSVNYTGQGQIQFTVVGVFGKIPEPAVAVDDISIAPCGESFPKCDFEDDDHPFCDWTQTSSDGGHWTRGHRNLSHLACARPFLGDHYIYLETDKFSQAGQSVRLVSRPFCAPGDICVEFAYHMYGLGEGTTLKLLLGSPAGSTPISLWNRVGSQSPYWQNTSITISSGHQQPMQLIFKAITGSSTAFVVAMDFILVNHGISPTAPPAKSPVSPTGPSETTGLTEKPTIPTETTTVPTEEPTISKETTTVSTGEPTIPTETTTVPTGEPTIPTETTTVPTGELTIPTETTTRHLSFGVEERQGGPPRKAVACRLNGGCVLPLESCPPNAHYESCACPASCKNPRPSCGLLCQGGCVCNPGFLFSDNRCINASSCNCFYSNNYYKTGAEWFSPNCTERCHCWPGSRIECQSSQCGAHTVCQLKNGQYGCHPYGSATCLVYGDPHYVTFDGRHFGFMGRCTYILAQPCGNSTDPFFRVTAKNDGWGQEGMACLNKVYVTLPETTITLLKGRRTLVGGQRVTLPAIPSKGVFLAASGRFVELQTEFGLWVRWDGDQQLFVSVARTYSSKLCGLCGNYDGDINNDHLKPDGHPAGDEEELGKSWQMAEDEDTECQENQTSPPSCDSALQNNMSGPGFCGRLVDSRGPFEACLLHLKATSFFDNCMFDMCNFQGLRQMLCAHMSAMTTSCQDAGYAVKPWREPQFCPLACPPNSKYSPCAKPCPDTCHSAFSSVFCPDRCVEACECNPGFVLSGLDCVPQSQCGCLDSNGSYFKVGEKWYKPGCMQLCVCEGNNRIHCYPWTCKAQETCGHQDGIYGCHAQGAATCTASGDPHYLTFDGALHHFMGTCTYVLTKLCWSRPQENYFVVSTSNENRGGIPEASFVKAVHVQVFGLQISLLKGCKVMLNGHQVALPVWPLEGQVTLRFSGSFVVLYTNFGLRVRYDGVHLVEVTVPSSYAGQLCGLCGNYNNNSLDDNLRPDRKPAGNSIQLGASWKLSDSSEPGCFLMGGSPSGCQEGKMADIWNKNCAILMDPQGSFSQCHQVVPPQASFASCVHGQCGTKGDTTALCHSLQAYASLCAQAGQAPVWRNSTFCPLKCPPGSSYSPCARPCPATCLSLVAPRDCPASLPCAEGCECQKGHILSGTSCVPFSQCGCVDSEGSYHLVGESWYTENTCSRLCTCSIHNNITCLQTTCKPNQMCWPLDGVLRCRASGMGVCRVSGEAQYVSFDGSKHSIWGTCTHVLMKVCHPNMNVPFFKISAKNKELVGRPEAFHLHQVYIDIYDSQITLQKDHHVLINGQQVTLPESSQIPGVSITSRGIHTIVNIKFGARVTFDGSHLLEIEIPEAYYGKVCGVCGNFNGEEEDELMMPSDELAWNDREFVESWKDTDIDPDCQGDNQQENLSENCRAADLHKAQEKCAAALKAPAWAQCASHMVLKPFLVGCANTLCEFGGLNRAFCEALQAFGSACQSQGLKPPLWRNSSFCPLECPAHSSYTNCLPPCSPSCWDLDGRCEGVKVPSTCAEGCICQPGYVLNEDKCVPRSQCSCKDDQGGFIPPGKTWISSGCTDSCVCMGGAIECRAFRCPSGSHCQPNSDHSNSNCIPDESKQCSVLGDPHYHTFDRLSYRFMGRMTYILITTVDVLPEGVERLLVEGRNKMHQPWSRIILHEVITTVYGYKVQLQAGLQLVVNDQKMAIPYRPNERLWVTLRGQRLYLVTDFELVVSFDGRRSAAISLPSTYQGLVRGLCGNYDRNGKNELMLPSGALTHNLNTFGNSWEVKTGHSLLRFPRALPEEESGAGGGAAAGFHVAACSPEQLALVNSTQACRVLADPLGPFAACHRTVAPKPFQEHCVLDLCSAGDPREQEELRCQVLSTYAILCQEAGVALAGWRDHTRCESPCLRNPCQNDGRCQERGASFTCQCELGYGGDLCTEPRDLPLPEMSASSSVAILLGMLVPVVAVVLAATRECVYRVRRRWR
uniref:Zonadhesin n=1 Tax=Propithecus coquereli TaxID=379532 RepID=A0A2K6EWG7_PROCO